MKRTLLAALFLFAVIGIKARTTFNFNSGWVIDNKKEVTLPHAWNEDESFKVRINEMSDSIVWYRKKFKLPKAAYGQVVYIEFEGARQAAEVWLNGHRLGISENGVMAFGFELTPYIKKGDNLLEVRTDNNWKYKSIETGSAYQWNNNAFNANYGGLPKNVWLHVCPPIHQTLPLFSNLGTTGVYVYGTDYDIKGHKATVHAESQIKNTSGKDLNVKYTVIIEEYDGRQIARFGDNNYMIKAGSTVTLKTQKPMGGLHFWSWGYGYLYRVKTIINNDTVTTVTGFRKTAFSDGMFYLNDRVMMVHGYAQRTSNEWPGIGMSAPAWLSDYSNNLEVKSGGNVVRWMHVTPWKQDVESCDRVGLIEAMPAGDGEGDVKGERWNQRVALMRDAIIYNRNNPSVIFIESGNESITKEHMVEMKTIRDMYDPNGGRAIGCREMLDIPESEYGGEMLYINKSETKPMWMMEYCRDEGLRKYWNSWSYPYHKEGDGPLHKGQPADSYNHNSDEFSVELIRRWYDYWMERPGTGTKVNSGGVKIVFSDTQTYGRSAENYRVSGVVDPMRIEKDAFFAHQVMWDGWVDDLKPHTYICGHWNYKRGETIPKVYVVSNSDSVQLFLNGIQVYKKPIHQYKFLYEFDNVNYESGELTAISYNANGDEVSQYTLHTAGEPDHLKLTKIENPTGWKADGADVALIQVEVVDKNGYRCPLDNRLIKFSLKGNAEWRGGIAQGKWNHVLCDTLPVESGINRVMLRSTKKAGNIMLSATAEGLQKESISLHTIAVKTIDGLSRSFPADGLKCILDKGETPNTPSFIQSGRDVPIASVEAGSNQETASNVYDGNELSSWNSDGEIENAWVTYTLAEENCIDNICLKMVDFRYRSYPITVLAEGRKIWEGFTPKSLGYIHIPVKGIKARKFTIKMSGSSTTGDAFGTITEVDSHNNDKIHKGNYNLRITETQFICKTNK